ncbi:arylsulfatase [Pantoea coffeiphila]|uniref:arylsulfatase n=1 Tax=Pantoea coffeiphila TaxID=1465635 RepID=UPI00195FBE48|nr:arylsulfatase [Pantoea coffeiphila]MBM7344851.1 aspartate/glutamate racemase [Pantoea coffeiphila]
MSQRIVMIHATPLAVAPINDTFAKQWPEADISNLLDDALSTDRAKVTEISPRLNKRIHSLVDYAVSINAAAVLFTCSAFGSAIDDCARQHTLPVLKPNEAMFEAALEQGEDIVMLATFAPAVAGMEAEFRDLASAKQSNARMTAVVVAGARDALNAGDVALHNKLIIEAARQNQHADAIVLAHFSMEVAFENVQAAVVCPVLSSPQAAVAKLKRLMS